MLVRLVPLVLAPLVAAISAGAPGPTLPAEGRLPLPPARSALTFDPGTTEIRLDELLQRFAQLTGQELAMPAQTQQILQKVKERLENLAPVPPEEVYAFVEGLLSRQDFVIAPITGGTRPILGVEAIQAQAGPTTLAPLYVDFGALSELDAHPALLVRLLLNFQNFDTRQLQTQLRQILVDSTGVSQCVPAGESSLILQGRARDLAGLARLLLDADKAAGARPRPIEKPVPTEKPQEGPR